MKIHRALEQLPQIKNAVITIGSFDGVHIGHQQIINRINEIAQAIDGESVLITFHPHPRIALKPENNSLRLITTLNEKAEVLRAYGVDHLVVVPFTKEFASQSPDEYIQNFLVKHFQPKRIVIGYDHKYGKNRVGDIIYLKNFETKYGYEVTEISPQEVEDIAVSSTKVRNALQQGEVARAAKLLGHSFVLIGKVVKGLQLGSQLGYPTANIKVAEPYKLIPPQGIYAVQVEYDSKVYNGMLYIGDRPTLEKELAQTIEVNIFDFDTNIYEELLKITFIKHIREDQKFDSLEDLKTQLGADKEAALNILPQIAR
ncbi:MAG: bifunctional riboflavin kinase/FAD synthetase [Aureispira sp.]|nr:bifunctional riboflavin kinase/FAD synthetase [Aureispira sp.]